MHYFHYYAGVSALCIMLFITPAAHGNSLHPNPVFLTRRTVYAFGPERVTDAELACLFEAARWAPSAWNTQPTRYLYARRGTPNGDLFLHLIGKGNYWWAQHAPVLAVLLKKKRQNYTGKQMDRTEFETGCSWMSLALQATMLGLSTHIAGEFDTEAARALLQVPETFDIVLMFGLGRQTIAGASPDLVARDRNRPVNRLSARAIACEGAVCHFEEESLS